MTAFTATAALPYEHLELTTAALRTEPSRQLLAADVHDLRDRHAYDVTGPIALTQLRSHTCYAYRTTVQSRRPLQRTTMVTRPGHPPMELT